MTGRILCLAIVLAVVAAPRAAAADETAKEAARAAYAEGQRALAAEDYDRAAAEFARADATVPSEIALEAALQAVARGTNPSLAAHLLRRTAGRSTPRVDSAAHVALGRYAGSLGRLRVLCPAVGTCAPIVDGEPVPPGEDTWTTRGEHLLTGTVGGAPATARRLVVTGTAATAVVLERATEAAAPTPPPAPDPERARPSPSRGLAPPWLFVGVATTLALGGVATWSTVDMNAVRDDFHAAQCGSVGSTSCDALARDGRAADVRTVALWAATGVSGIATALAAAFFVDWGKGSSVGVVPVDGGAFVAFRGSRWR